MKSRKRTRLRTAQLDLTIRISSAGWAICFGGTAGTSPLPNSACTAAEIHSDAEGVLSANPIRASTMIPLTATRVVISLEKKLRRRVGLHLS